MDKLKTLVVVCILLPGVLGILQQPNECGSSVGCFSSCDGDSCKFVVTWKDTGSAVEFSVTLQRETTSTDEWIALGLSSDKLMGVDSVTDCIMTNGQAGAQKSYNVEKFNEQLRNPQEGLSAVRTSISDGVLSCTFSQNKTSSNEKIFNLNDDWYLLVAHGTASGGIKNRHSLAPLPEVSGDKVNLQENKVIGVDSRSLVLVKLHGTFMMFAWMFCASIGIVLARFYKPMWPSTTICKEKVWFTFHRLCMVLAFLFCSAAFVMIFVEEKEWSALPGHSNFQKAHPYIGVIIMFFVILNPVMALFRPHPDEKNRYLFNWAHWLVGTSAHILSAIGLILGVTLAKASVPYYCVWVLLAWAAYQFLAVIFLELHECYITAPKRKRYIQQDVNMEPHGKHLKFVFMCLHVMIITGLTAACIIIVAIH